LGFSESNRILFVNERKGGSENEGDLGPPERVFVAAREVLGGRKSR